MFNIHFWQTCLISKVDKILCKDSFQNCPLCLQGSQSPTSTLSPEATTQQVMLARNEKLRWNEECGYGDGS